MSLLPFAVTLCIFASMNAATSTPVMPRAAFAATAVRLAALLPLLLLSGDRRAR